MAVEESTPYTSVMQLVEDTPSWVPELDAERIASYKKYDDVYWNVPESFKLLKRGDDAEPIYVPKPRTVADTTAQYLLKGLVIQAARDAEELSQVLEDFLEREKFYSKFHSAKHAGVVRGDFLLHLTADPDAPEGRRISVNSVMPWTYFPIRDPDDVNRVVGVDLAEEFFDPESKKTLVRALSYRYKGEFASDGSFEPQLRSDGTRVVTREENILASRDWFDPMKREVVEELLPLADLEDPIDRIPVYHFKNITWDGEPFGRSELSGFERLMAGIDQSMSDEEVALALEGLGVYATDGGSPVDAKTGLPTEWEISPARVMELPLGSYFKRVDGVGSVTPLLDHVNKLEAFLHEASGTSDVARGEIDVQTAESGIALAIRFMPTLAKIEERDRAGLDLLRNFWFDWKIWWKVFEGQDFGDIAIDVRIGEKLPINRTAVLNELNNMLDRDVISKQFYREQMNVRLGYNIPDSMEQEILGELRRERELQTELMIAQQTKLAAAGLTVESDDRGSKSKPPSTSGGDPRVTKKFDPDNKLGEKRNRNGSRVNESAGAEA